MVSALTVQANTSQPISPAKVPFNNIEQLIKQVELEATTEQQHNLEREKRFIQQRDKQKQRLDELKKQIQTAQQQSEQMRSEYQQNQQQLNQLDQELNQQAGELTSLFAVAKQNAGELDSLINQSLVTAQFPLRSQIIHNLIGKQSQTLSMQDLKQLWMLLLEEMHQSGKIQQFNTAVISPNGQEIKASVTRSGVFNATSQGKLLRYLPETGKLVQLARQPSQNYQDIASAFEQQQPGITTGIVDPSKGKLLNLLLQTPDFKERIQQGGFIAYIILAFGALGLLIVLIRYLLLTATAWQITKQLQSSQTHTSQSNTSQTHTSQTQASQAKANNPMGRLMILLDKTPDLKAESMSIRLDEAVNSEAHRLHFGLKTLAIVAAITPLLGLLGTVTGMIETFQSISLFGSGDPKLMSGGISQALVTTQLGLAVAIPILLMHALLQGKANRLIELLDAQSALLFEKYSNRSMIEHND